MPIVHSSSRASIPLTYIHTHKPAVVTFQVGYYHDPHPVALRPFPLPFPPADGSNIDKIAAAPEEGEEEGAEPGSSPFEQEGRGALLGIV